MEVSMCKQLAEWLIRDRDPMMHSFSCTEHLPQLVTDTTEGVEPTDRGGGAGTTCDYLEPLEAVAEVIENWQHELCEAGRPTLDDVYMLVEGIRMVLQ